MNMPDIRKQGVPITIAILMFLSGFTAASVRSSDLESIRKEYVTKEELSEIRIAIREWSQGLKETNQNMQKLSERLTRVATQLEVLNLK